MTSALVSNIFSQQNALSEILAKVKKLQQLNAIFLTFLPANFHPVCCIANYREGQLIIQADNAAVATQLKYQTGELLSQFRKQGLPGLCAIQVIVRPKFE